MIDLDEYKRLEKRANDAQSQADRAVGAVEQIKQRLLKEFGCADLEEAQTELKKLERLAEQTDNTYKEELERLQEEHPGLFK